MGTSVALDRWGIPLKVAAEMGRRYLGIVVSPTYAAKAESLWAQLRLARAAAVPTLP